MQKRNKVFLLVCLVLTVFSAQQLWGQYNTKIWATDGSGITDTLQLAIDPAGTAGFDSLSPTLREYEIPVHAFGLDFRVATNLPDDNIGLGAYTSIHHMSRPTQTDKWKLQFNVDSGRTSLDVTWPAGLGSVGGGMWILRANPSDPIAFADVDMTTQTTFSIPVSDNDPHTFYIVTGDKQKYRSFTSNEIATAQDSKHKNGKAEARKPYGSEGNFVFTNPGVAKTDIHIEWSQGIDDGTLSISQGATHAWADAPKNTKLDVTFTGTVDSLGSVTIFARGNKGKQLVAKKYWWTVGGVQTPAKVKLGPVLPSSGDRLLLRMPNTNNVGEELYSQGVFAAPNGLYVGDPVNQSGVDIKLKPFFKAVIHPKWKDVVKTVLGKAGNVQDQPARCLDNFDGSLKPILKVQKSLPPEKHDNVLLGDAVALKFNIGAGDGQKIEEGGTAFGDLIYVPQTGDPAGVPAGSSVRAIAAKCDSVLRCLTQSWGGTPAEWDAMISRINSSFSGTFDTISFGNPSGTKPAGTKVKGVKAIADVPYLYRASFEDILPAYNAPNIAKLEARNQPEQYTLSQNYPNPFNPTTTIEFALPEDAFVTLKVYNMLGQEVLTLINHEQMDSGTNEVTFDASQFASGVYYYRMIVNDGQFQQVKKMLLVK